MRSEGRETERLISAWKPVSVNMNVTARPKLEPKAKIQAKQQWQQQQQPIHFRFFCCKIKVASVGDGPQPSSNLER